MQSRIGLSLMRKPRIKDFDPNASRYSLEEIDVSDVTPIQDRKQVAPKEKSSSSLREEDDRSSEQANDRSNERMNKRTGVQMNEQTDERMNERSSVQDYRTTIRASFDVFIDQVEYIDDLVNQRKKQAHRHVTKGEVIRQVIDFYKKHHAQ